MKKIIFLVMLFVYSNSIGQNNCVNEVSTNPDAPFNSNLPLVGSSTIDDERFVNSFVWYQNENIPLNNFLSIYPSEMTKLNFDSHSYYSFLSSGEELTPQNGWELMLFNTGYYPDQSPANGLGTQDLPYIALYNRLTGILRVFGSYGVSPVVNGGMSFDGLRITLNFDLLTDLSGNLRLRNGNDRPLDKNTEATLTQSMALHPNSPSQWFCADFQLAYDPCICYYPSKMRLGFDFYETKEIKLQGRSISVTDEIANGNHLLTNDFLTNFQNTVVDAQGNFSSEDQIIMYKVMDDFVEDYIERLEKYKLDLESQQEYNNKIERNLVIVKLFKKVVIDGATYGVSSLIGEDWFQDALEFADDFIPSINANDSTVAIYRDKLEGEAKKAISSGVETFIKKNFEKKPEPSKPDAPVANFTETIMNGRLTEKISVQKPAFYTPGSFGTAHTSASTPLNNPLAYPIYNNAVGTFALLNTPKLKAYKSEREIINQYTESYEIQTNGNVNPERFRGYKSWGGNYQFQLNNDIYYAVNDVNIKSHSIKLAIALEGKVAKTTSLDCNVFSDPTSTINMKSMDIETDEYYPIVVTNGKGFNFGGNYCPNIIGTGICTSEQNDLPKLTYSKDTLNFMSPYYSIDAASPIVFSVGIVNDLFFPMATSPNFLSPEDDGYKLENFKAKLKLLVDVVYHDLDENGKNITSTLMFTYDVDDIDWGTTPLSTDLQNSPVNYSAFEENLVLNTTDFDGSPVQGCKLVGTHYTCHGWDDVTIVGDLTTSGGHTVDIFGANNVFVIDESNVSPEIVLDIQTLLDYTDPMPRASTEFIESYCKNQLGQGFPAYSANVPSKSALEEFEAFTADKPADPSFDLLSVNLYPVPTSDLLNVRSSVKLSGETFTLVDLSGRLLELPTRKLSDLEYEINVSSLAVGSYYLNIISNEGRATKMFTVTKNN